MPDPPQPFAKTPVAYPFAPRAFLSLEVMGPKSKDAQMVVDSAMQNAAATAAAQPPQQPTQDASTELQQSIAKMMECMSGLTLSVTRMETESKELKEEVYKTRSQVELLTANNKEIDERMDKLQGQLNANNPFHSQYGKQLADVTDSVSYTHLTLPTKA